MTNFQKSFDRLDQYITQRIKTTGTPGLALAMFDRESCVRVSTYGVSEIETQTPVKPDTLFEIGSITKSFTAVAVVQAAERGWVDLHAPITEYLPWFQVQSKFAPITVHHLLTHSAGIVGIIDRSPDTRGAVWALREMETAWAPGTHFFYSDAGYQALGLMLEEVTGRSYADIIQTNIFDKLEMTASKPALTHAIRPFMAKGYCSLYDDRPYHLSHPFVLAPWIETNAGDCCIASTAEDMTRFGRMLLNQGQVPHGAVLSPASCNLLTSQPLATGFGFSYGYGLEVHQRENFTHIGHGGGMPGYEAFILMDTDNGVGAALLSTKPSISIRSLAWDVIGVWRKAYLGEPPGSAELSLSDPMIIENTSDYVGKYQNEHDTLTLTAEDRQLILHYRDVQIVLERRSKDCFYANHPDFNLFLLEFGRAETDDPTPGCVVEVCYGPEWYVNDRYKGPRAYATLPGWNAYKGHYRAHIPWQTNFRVILRKGSLWLVLPDGNEEPLTSLEDRVFRVGDDTSPERLRFDQFINGKAFCANYSGSNYYRFFTP